MPPSPIRDKIAQFLFGRAHAELTDRPMMLVVHVRCARNVNARCEDVAFIVRMSVVHCLIY